MPLSRRLTPSSDASEPAPYPLRDIDNLYCQSLTYLCAIGALPRSNDSRGAGDDEQDSPATAASTAGTAGTCCVPCAYKICNFDICLDSDFTKRILNQRPEQCPRSHLFSTTAHGQSNLEGKNDGGGDTVSQKGTMGYHRGMNVLTVGDGDFTFSLAVARLVVADCNSNCCRSTTVNGGMVVATSYENNNTLRAVYPDFDKTLNALTRYGEHNVIVAYNVDATRLEETLPKQLRNTSHANKNQGVKFHRICWNFPCTAIKCGQDGQNDAMEQNKELIRKFVVNALPFLDDDCGEIHMAHKTKPPYNQWLLEKVALEGIRNQVDMVVMKHAREFEFKGKIVFDRCSLPPYTPRKALDRKSFPCHDACVYVFGWKNSNNDDCDNRSTLATSHASTSENELESPLPSSIIPVTTDMVNNIRLIHLEESDARMNFAFNKKTGSSNKRRRKV